MKDAETKLNIIHGIMENVSLHRTADSYKNAPDAEKVAYLEGSFAALWAVVFAK